MRILHVSSAYHPSTAYGGPIVSMHQLAAAMAAQGHQVEVLTTDADGERRVPLRQATFDGVAIRYHRTVPLNRYGVSPGLWWRVAREVARHDVVHLHGVFLPSTTLGLVAAHLRGTPAVVSPHGALMRWALGYRASRKQLYRRVDAWLLRRALVHATSEAEAADLAGLGFRDVALVPNGVDPALLATPGSVDVRARLGLPVTARVVAWLGRFDPVKNLEVLLEATRGLGVHLLLAGDHACGHGERLAAAVRKEGRSDVHLLGHVELDEKRSLLQQADVYAHPSLMESYGMSIVEALAAGCPVVASTGTPWSALDGAGAGRWVAPTAAAFRGALQDLLQHPTPARRAAARALAETHAWSRRARAMVEAYQRYAAGERAGGGTP